MHKVLFVSTAIFLAGCSSQGVVYHSPYDLNRDGTLDARCPGMTYDTDRHSSYGWRSKASGECAEQAPLGQG